MRVPSISPSRIMREAVSWAKLPGGILGCATVRGCEAAGGGVEEWSWPVVRREPRGGRVRVLGLNRVRREEGMAGSVTGAMAAAVVEAGGKAGRTGVIAVWGVGGSGMRVSVRLRAAVVTEGSGSMA